MRVLVLGANGMLGHKLTQTLAADVEVSATVRSPTAGLGDALHGVSIREGVDASDPGTVATAIDEARPDVVVNCIGIVKQAAAASEAIPSITINALFPHQLSELCGGRGVRLVHISTDCVFSGRTGSYTETDQPDPVDLYGATKWLGEVVADGALTIRTSMIGRELATSFGLVEWFLGEDSDTVRGYRKAVFSGFTTAALSELVRRVIVDLPDLSGLCHVSADPISKYDLLRLLRAAFDIDIDIEPDDSVICDRSLGSGRFWAAAGGSAPSWPTMIEGLASETGPYRQPRRKRAH